MSFKVVLLVLYFVFRCCECSIFRWNNPPVNGAFGSGTVNERIYEGSTGSLNIHISAESDKQFPVYSVVRNPDGMEMSIDKYHGQLTLVSGSLDFESATTVILVVRIEDGESVGTATCTIRLLDINDNAPHFGVQSLSVVTEDHLGGGSIVAIVSATDRDATFPNNEVYYVLTNGNTGGDFTISNTGAITVVRGKTLAHDRTPTYSLFILALDDGTYPGTLSTSITVGICVGQCPVPSSSTMTTPSTTTEVVTQTSTVVQPSSGKVHLPDIFTMVFASVFYIVMANPYTAI